MITLYHRLVRLSLIGVAYILIANVTMLQNLVLAQDEPFFTTQTPPSHMQMYWSTDGSMFTFNESERELLHYTYNIQQAHLDRVDQWTLQYELTNQQLEQFEVGISTRENRLSHVILSPNGRYIVYGSVEPENWFSSITRPVGIANLHTANHQVFENAYIAPFLALSSFGSMIYWSADSSTIVIITDSGFGVSTIYHLSNISDDLSEVVVTSMDCLTLNAGDDTSCRDIIDLWDIASDGQKVLFSTFGERHNERRGHALLVWDVANETQSQIIMDGNIVNAAFYPDDDDALLFIGASGLVEYNLITNEQYILDKTLSEETVDAASFSPNSEYLVIVIIDPNVEEWNLYLKDLSEYTE